MKSSIMYYIERKELERAGDMCFEQGRGIFLGSGVNTQYQNWHKIITLKFLDKFKDRGFYELLMSLSI